MIANFNCRCFEVFIVCAPRQGINNTIWYSNFIIYLKLKPHKLGEGLLLNGHVNLMAYQVEKAFLLYMNGKQSMLQIWSPVIDNQQKCQTFFSYIKRPKFFMHRAFLKYANACCSYMSTAPTPMVLASVSTMKVLLIPSKARNGASINTCLREQNVASVLGIQMNTPIYRPWKQAHPRTTMVTILCSWHLWKLLARKTIHRASVVVPLMCLEGYLLFIFFFQSNLVVAYS